MNNAVIAAGTALALAALAGCASSSSGSASAPALVVGEFNPFSGPDAAFGPEMVGGCVPATRPTRCPPRRR